MNFRTSQKVYGWCPRTQMQSAFNPLQWVRNQKDSGTPFSVPVIRLWKRLLEWGLEFYLYISCCSICGEQAMETLKKSPCVSLQGNLSHPPEENDVQTRWGLQELLHLYLLHKINSPLEQCSHWQIRPGSLTLYVICISVSCDCAAN